jgi:hypothetical protein
VLQILPIALWWQFHRQGISDGTPPSAFVAHWGFSAPHIALLAISALMVYGTLFRRKQD